jgi:hypothetical protein
VGAGLAPPLGPASRLHVRERLSVALLTGDSGPGNIEVVRYLAPLLRVCGVRTKLWAHAGADRSLPGPDVLEEVFVWLEMGLPARQALFLRRPASRLGNVGMPTADAWSLALLQEALGRLEGDAAARREGALQLRAVVERWPGTATALEAERRLRDLEARAAGAWRKAYLAEQREYAYRLARAHDAVVEDALAGADAGRKLAVVREGVAAWALVAELAGDTKEGREAAARLARLRPLLPAGAP